MDTTDTIVTSIITTLDPKGDIFLLDLFGVLYSYLKNDPEAYTRFEKDIDVDAIIVDALQDLYDPSEAEFAADELDKLGFSTAADMWRGLDDA